MRAADYAPDEASAASGIGSGPPVDIALFVPNLEGGGAERMMVRLGNWFADEGFSVDLVLGRRTGAFVREVADNVRIVDLGRPRVSGAIVPLARYLRRRRPGVLLSTLNHANVGAAISLRLSGCPTRLMVRQASVLTAPHDRSFRARVGFRLLRWAYDSADTIVAISEGVRSSLVEALEFGPERVEVIYNPAHHPSIAELGRVPPPEGHPFDDGIPVFVAVGSLRKQKDYPTLITAFSRLRCRARLLILGEGPERGRLEALMESLGVADSVTLQGFVQNPFSYIQRARGLVLASRSEGFGNVVVEAMALGTQVIVTDCPGGPAEIVDSGRYGAVVPAGDAAAMAEALCAIAERDVVTPPELVARAEEFSVPAIAARYLDLFGLRVIRENDT